MNCFKCNSPGEQGSFKCRKCGALNTCCARCGVFLPRASSKNANYVLNQGKTYLVCKSIDCQKEGDIQLWASSKYGSVS